MTAAPPPDPRLGTVIDGRYTLVRRLGAGGTGVVYQAEQRAMGRTGERGPTPPPGSSPQQRTKAKRRTRTADAPFSHLKHGG